MEGRRGLAGDVAGAFGGVLEDADAVAEGPGLVGVGEAVEGDQGGAEGGGEVHAPAVVAEHDGGKGEDGGEVFHGGFAGEV